MLSRHAISRTTRGKKERKTKGRVWSPKLRPFLHIYIYMISLIHALHQSKIFACLPSQRGFQQLSQHRTLGHINMPLHFMNPTMTSANFPLTNHKHNWIPSLKRIWHFWIPSFDGSQLPTKYAYSMWFHVSGTPGRHQCMQSANCRGSALSSSFSNSSDFSP